MKNLGKSEFRFFDNAPDAVVFIKVTASNDEFKDYEIIYANNAIEKIGNLTKKDLFNKKKEEQLISLRLNKPELCYKVAYQGEKTETIEYDKSTGKYIKIDCWQIEIGYCGFIITDITDKFLIEALSNKHYKKLEALLKNSVDIIFDLDLDTLIMCSDGYSKEKNRLIEKEYKIPEDWTRRELITKTGEERVNQIIQEIKQGSEEASTKIELRKSLEEPFEWHKIVLFAYEDYMTRQKKVIGYAKNIHRETVLLSRLQRQVNKDLMTGIYNVTAAKKRIKKILDTNTYNAFFIIDIDDFKNINDTYGHPCGDKAIKLVANVLNNSFRKSDIVYRLGGDEFAGFTIGMNNEKYIKVLCNDIRKNLAESDIVDSTITVSIGVSLNKDVNATYEEYYDAADKALYKAKIQGKNGYFIEYF